MPQALRLRTFPEILAAMMARATKLLDDDDLDLLPGSALRTLLECASLQDAEQYVQLRRLVMLFALDNCMGDDLDERAVEIGSDVFTSLRRRPANTSVSKIVVGDGTLIHTTKIAADVPFGSATFSVTNATGFPVAGAIVISQGTEQEEDVIYTRSGTVFTVVFPGSALRKSHAANESVTLVSTRSTLAAQVNAGTSSASLLAGTGAAWALTGTVIFERGTSNQEKIAFTRTGDTLALAAPATFTHASGTVVIQSTTGTDRNIAAGPNPFVPATDTSAAIPFKITLGGVLLDGDFISDLIDVESVNVGADTNAGANTITKWTTPPFTGATVTNPAAATRGATREDDDPYRQRLKDFIQSLSRGTPLAVVTLVDGVTDPSTNTTVAFAQIIEPVSPGRSILYITDGTDSFTLGQQPFIGRDTVISDAEVGDRRGRLAKTAPYSYSPTTPVAPRLFVSNQRGVATSVGAGFLEDTSQNFVINSLVGMWLKTVDDQFYQITSNTAIRIFITPNTTVPALASYSVFDFSVSPLVPGTDFQFNPSTGDLELATALVAHDGLVAASDGASLSLGAYLYATGLAAFAQRVVNGDPTDFADFPGIRSTGTQVLVAAPTVISKSFVIRIVPMRGFTLAQLTSPVQVAVEAYVNAQGLGGGVILAKIIEDVMGLPGVADCSVLEPTSNIVVPGGTLIRITDVDVEIV
jgi:uncharacterized phage protein gp47/JayE